MNETAMTELVAQLLMDAISQLPMDAHAPFIENLTAQAIWLLRGQYDEEFVQGFLDAAKKDPTAIRLEYVTQKH